MDGEITLLFTLKWEKNLHRIVLRSSHLLGLMPARGIVLAILLGCATPAAMASTGSFSGNTCDLVYKGLLEHPQVVEYSKTGKLSAHWKPEHSRAFYMALLGMRDLLRSYLKNHRQVLQYSELLTAATETDQKAIVAMLLRMGENPNRNGSETSALPLQTAASCERGTIMVYLLSAGADVYGVSLKSDFNAMATALIPSRIDGQPFLKGVRLLLAAGFDPRCPVDSKGQIAADLVTYSKPDPKDKIVQKTKDLLETSANIMASKNPGKPHCGESGRQFRKADK